MARLLSPIASVLRGSIAGLTFLSNQYHQIVVRARTSPVNPKTTNQTYIRQAWGGAATLWAELPAADKLLWDQYADTVVFSGPLGDYTVPGRQIFIGTLGLANYIDARALDSIVPGTDPPVLPGRPSFSSLSIQPLTAPGTGFEIKCDNDTDEDILAFAERSFAFGDSRNRFKGPFLSSTATAVDITSKSSGIVPFSGLIDGSVYFAVVRGIVTDPPHRLTSLQILRAVAEITAV